MRLRVGGNLERFLTSSQGREPSQAMQGGPGGKFEGLMEALMQKTMRMASRATTTVHITLCRKNSSVKL